MSKINRAEVERLVRELLVQQFSKEDEGKQVDPSGVMAIKLPLFDVSEEHRLDTGNPQHRVYTRDLVSLEESPRLGMGLMVMEDTNFDWRLSYDEICHLIEGSLSIIVDGRTITAHPGEVIYLPKDANITFSVQGKARFLYVTYPADWQG